MVRQGVVNDDFAGDGVQDGCLKTDRPGAACPHAVAAWRRSGRAPSAPGQQSDADWLSGQDALKFLDAGAYGEAIGCNFVETDFVGVRASAHLYHRKHAL